MWGLSSKQNRVVIGCVLCSFFCTVFAMSLLSAMRAITDELHTDYVYVMWMNEATFISAIMFSMITIAVANKYGKTPTQMAGLVLIAISAVLSAFATNINILVCTKLIAGVGVSFIVTSNTSIIADMVEKKYIGEALAVNYAFSCLGAAAGPLLGLWIGDLIGWRGVTLIIAPVAFLLIYLIRGGDNIAYEPDSKIDIIPHILFVVGVGCLLNSFFVSERNFWMFYVGLVVIAGFAFTQLKSEKKILDTTIFDNKMFMITALLGLMFYFATYCIDDAIVDRLEYFGDVTIVVFGVTVAISALGGIFRSLKPAIQLVASPLLARLGRGKNPMKLTMYAFILLLTAPIFDLYIKEFVKDVNVAVILVIVVYVVLALSSSIFSPQNKGIMIECVRQEQRNTAASVSSIVDNFGRLLGVMIMVNVIYLYGETSSLTLDYSTFFVVVMVFIVAALGVFISFTRSRMGSSGE